MKTVKRRDALRYIGAGMACLAAGTAPAGAGGRPGRPNIIFLLTDDQRWDAAGCMGNPVIRTPNMDKLAREGVLFENAYVTTPICCSSRASILTGQYTRRHGINDFFTDFTREALDETYPMLLRKAGYRTGFVGKYGVGNTDKAMPVNKFDVWYGFPGWGKYEQKDERGRYKHLTRIMGEQCLEFLRGCPPDRPFCLSVSFKAPHVQDEDPRQFIPDPAYDALYRDVTIPPPVTAAPEYFEALPEFLRKSEARVRWKKRFATPEMYQRSVKNYYRLVTGVDTVLGLIREELKRLSLDGNTVIIFTSDNGFYLGEHGLAGKWFGHEESIRVPLFIYDPRLPGDRRGRRLDGIALNIDIAPTILSLAGVPVPPGMQGRDLAPLVHGTADDWRTDFLFEHHFDKHPLIPKSEGVVTERFKYIVYFEQDPQYEELYDIENDPHEKNNLAGDPRYGDVLERLRRRLAELREAAE